MEPVRRIFEGGRLFGLLPDAGRTLSRDLYYFDPFFAYLRHNQCVTALISAAQINRIALVVGMDPRIVRRNFDHARVGQPWLFAQVKLLTLADRCCF